MYAIVGAAGKVGYSTALALRKAGVPVRAIVRDESKAGPLIEIGCDIAVADLRDPAALGLAVGNADAVQVILPQDGVGEMHRSIESLAKARVAFLESQLFGTKSEKMTTIDPTQAILDLGDLSDIPVAANEDVAPVVEGNAQTRRSPARNIGHLPKHLPRYDELIESSKSALGKAVSYTLNHWGGLTAFLDDGRVEVDSNVVERSMKSVALTRKNSLFVGSERGGKSFAVLASLVNTAKLNGVDPEVWLADVLERIISGKVKANEMESLLPWTWKAEREAITQQERRAA